MSGLNNNILQKIKELKPNEEKLIDEFYAKELLNSKDDMVNSPPHYNKAGIECIEVLARIDAQLRPSALEANG